MSFNHYLHLVDEHQGRNHAVVDPSYDRDDTHRWANIRLVREGEHGPPPSQNPSCSGGPPRHPSTFGIEHHASLSKVLVEMRGNVPGVDGAGAKGKSRQAAPYAGPDWEFIWITVVCVSIFLFFL